MKNLTLINKILIAVAIVLTIVSLMEPNIGLKYFRKLIGDYKVNDIRLAKEIDSLRAVKTRDSIRYMEALQEKELQYEYEISKAQDNYNRLNKRFKQNEKELDNYRNSSFDDKFRLFSGAVIGKDTVQR